MNIDMQSPTEKIRLAKEQILAAGLMNQHDAIRQASPYSSDITSWIQQFDELRLYVSLQLCESYLTRPTLVQDIDFDMWVSAEGCTNEDLMRKGKPPYAFDAPEGRIELHHIGQNYAAPFVEITTEDHDENSQLLHSLHTASWRNDATKEREFEKERITYWKMRAKKNYIVSECIVDSHINFTSSEPQDYQNELRQICEIVFSQADIHDLDYLSDLAKSFSMMRRVGAMSIGEFLANTREAQQLDIHCPACNASDYVLHGTYKAKRERIQRYKCNQCGKVFSPLHKTLIYGSKFSLQDWIKFIDCLYNGYTIGQTAEYCGISERTAYDNRIKLFYALKILNDRVQMQGNVVLDETYFLVSFKGNHSKQEAFVMPRAAHERGRENYTRGLSKNLVCVVCALDDMGNSVAKVAGRGNSSGLKLRYALEKHLSENVTCLYSDKSPSIRKFAEYCSLDIKQAQLLRKGAKISIREPFNRDTFITNRYLQIINSYHSRLKKFMARFSGISTKYLSGYLYLFAWRERSKEMEPKDAYRELLEVMTAPNFYLSTDDIVQGEYFADVFKLNRSNYYRLLDFPGLMKERNNEIYARYARGETMTSIAKDLGITKQRVSIIIDQFRKRGLAYRTEWDVRQEMKEKESSKKYFLRKTALRTLDRNFEIYHARQKWSGTPREFIAKMRRKYKLSTQTIKNILSMMGRIHQLMDEIFIFEDVSYRSTAEVYQNIYTDYLAIKGANPAMLKCACAEDLAEKYGFVRSNIIRILEIMTTETPEYFLKKRKLTTTETYNRDKALFIDFLRWTGDRMSFCEYAKDKYHLSAHYISQIIGYCMRADLNRYNMV